MTAFGPLRLSNDDAPAGLPPEPPRPPPKVLVRVFTVPLGLPWEQARAAGLEARHGSPLPIAEVALLCRRLQPWRPGEAGRYVALYVLASEVGDGFETSVEVDGRSTPVRFASPQERSRAARRLVLVGFVAAVVSAVIAVAGLSSLAIRDEARTRLVSAEMGARARLRLALQIQSQRTEVRALEAVEGRGAPLDEVLSDLGHASGAQAPEAWIDAFHWERGLVAVEAHGDDPPLRAGPGQRVERSQKPIRSGVYLWSLGPDGPVAAETNGGHAGGR
jgi:hypothetical protein